MLQEEAVGSQEMLNFKLPFAPCTQVGNLELSQLAPANIRTAGVPWVTNYKCQSSRITSWFCFDIRVGAAASKR